VLLGGRIAEELIFKDITTGAENDLVKTTEMANKMVCEYGMSERLGSLTFKRNERQIFLGRDITKEKAYSEKTAEVIDEEVKSIIDECLERGRKLLGGNKKKLERLAKRLIESEILDGDEVEKILNGKES